MSDYVKIKSISIDMSTEESPYNRIYAKPIEKQGDVLLCDFESANYDIEQKALKEENTKLKELLKECRSVIHGAFLVCSKEMCDKIDEVLEK